MYLPPSSFPYISLTWSAYNLYTQLRISGRSSITACCAVASSPGLGGRQQTSCTLALHAHVRSLVLSPRLLPQKSTQEHIILVYSQVSHLSLYICMYIALSPGYIVKDILPEHAEFMAKHWKTATFDHPLELRQIT